MHTITPHPDRESAFRLETNVREAALDMARTVAVVEGRGITDTIRKIFIVYDDLDRASRGYGRRLYSATDTSLDDGEYVFKPNEFVASTAMPAAEPRTPLTLTINESFKDLIESNTERRGIDFDQLMTASFAYYGLLAAQLYDGKQIFLQTYFPKRLTRMVILD